MMSESRAAAHNTGRVGQAAGRALQGWKQSRAGLYTGHLGGVTAHNRDEERTVTSTRDNLDGHESNQALLHYA